jgi:hypothetical protein
MNREGVFAQEIVLLAFARFLMRLRASSESRFRTLWQYLAVQVDVLLALVKDNGGHD